MEHMPYIILSIVIIFVKEFFTWFSEQPVSYVQATEDDCYFYHNYTTLLRSRNLSRLLSSYQNMLRPNLEKLIRDFSLRFLRKSSLHPRYFFASSGVSHFFSIGITFPKVLWFGIRHYLLVKYQKLTFGLSVSTSSSKNFFISSIRFMPRWASSLSSIESEIF